jgi:hypothetical protein
MSLNFAQKEPIGKHHQPRRGKTLADATFLSWGRSACR